MKAYLCFALLAAGAAAADQRATVNEETAPVYSHQRRSEDEIVKSLKRGDAVVIQFSIASEDGEWCAVSEPDDVRTPLGYMLCRHLQRDPAREERIIPLSTRAVPSNTPKAPAVSDQVPPARRDPAVEAGEDYARPMRDWATAFHFTVEQQATVDDLANSTGVTDCRRQYEAYQREYARELEMGARPYLPKQLTPAELQRIQNMVRELNRFWYPCMVKMLELLERYPGLMTPEQQSNAQAWAIFRKELAERRRGITSPDMSHTIR